MSRANLKKKNELNELIKEKWTYLDDRDGDFPEAYLLAFDGNKLKVELSREKKQVKIYAETSDGGRYESSITNGIIIEERDLSTGTKEDLQEEFTKLGRYLSAIPDSKLIRLIGGNYGVISEFIQIVQQYANKDVMILKSIFLGFALLPLKVYEAVIQWFREILIKPRVSDIIDAGIIITGGYLTYLYNFDFALSGLVVMIGSVLSGYFDWFIRRKEPYVLKVIVMFIPAFYILSLGMRFQ